jgi:iduronate 2-sulfatase
MARGEAAESLNGRISMNWLLASLVALAPLAAPAGAAGAPKQPNVVFLVLEDVSPDRFGTYGNPVCKTPHMDRLAAQGVRFDGFYSTPPCCPSRTSMISGMRPENTKVLDNSDAKLVKDLFASVTILPEQFQKAGYETVRIGKFAHDDQKPGVWSRVVFRGEGAEDEASKKQGKEEGKPAQGPHADPEARFTGARFLYGPTGLDEKQHSDHHVAGAAIKVLGEKGDKPLFLTAGFHANHLAFRAPDKYFAMYPAEQMTIPQNTGALPDGMPTKKIFNQIRKESGFNAMGFNNPATLEQWREAIAAQYACLTFVDVQIGRILDAIEEKGMARDTIVVLWSDHGFMLGEHFFWRKGQLYDTSCRSACIIRAPGISKGGAVCRRIVEGVDLYPTLLELCGLPAANHVEGVSFAPLLKNPDLPWKKGSLIYREKGKAVGLVTERWRYNRFEDQPERDQLFDHDADPGEQVNLIQDPQHAGALSELRTLMDAGWQACLPKPQPK